MNTNPQTDKDNTSTHISPSTQNYTPNPNNGSDTFGGLIVANATFRTPLLPLSETMPHIHLPIGTGEPRSDGTLCAMIDSGAGCNLGRKAYHLSIYEKFPQLIHAVESEVSSDEWQNISIGHIDADGQPILISAVITYKTPYKLDGHPVTI